MSLISVVVPVYKCAGSIVELHKRLQHTFSTLDADYELLLVDDASPDEAWSVIIKLVEQDTHVRGIKFSRNFGQHYAIRAGLAQARGEWIVVMDGDLQDQPEEIAKLYQATNTGFDIVLARRSHRQDTLWKRTTSHLFYTLLSYLTDTKLDPTVGNFGIYHRKVVNAVLSLDEQLQFFPLLVRWVGFSSSSIDVAHATREKGKSSYSLSRLFHLGFNVIVQFSNKPLRLTIQAGAGVALLSIIYATIIFVRAFLGLQLIQGWPSLIVSIWFLSGLLMMVLGVVGLYVGKAFDQSKKRPLYIIDKTYERN